MTDNVTLLLVDDLEANLVAMAALLRGPGLRVLKARSGSAALELLLVNEVALALVDVQMPGMDGFELAELMRGSQRTKHVPIVFVTAGAHDRKRMFQGYDSGAVDFLYKPIEPHILTNKVNVFVELFRQKQALARVSTLQRAIFNSANFSSIATDAKGVIQIFNVGAGRMLGYTAAEVINKITPADISDPQEVIARAKALSVELGTPIAPGFEALVFKASRGIEDIYELNYIRKDGSRFPAVVSVTALRDAHEAIIGYLLIGTDNTARKQSEEALRESETRFRVMADNIAPLAWMANVDGWIFFYNRRWFDYTGTTLEEMQGWGWEKVLHPDHLPRMLPTWKAALERGQPWEDTFPLRGHDGEYRWFLSRALPVRDASGKIVRWFGTNTDISEARAAQEALRESEARFRQIADTMPQIAWAAHPDGYIDYYNERWYEFTGFSRHEFGQPSWEPVLHPDDVQRCVDTYFACIRSGTPYRIEHRFKDRSSGGYRWFMGQALPVRDGRGEITRWFGTYTDIDAQKRAEEKLEATVTERTAKLQETVYELESYSYSISHDLRAPLRGIQSFAQILEEECRDEIGRQGREYIRRIVTAADRMDRLIQDVLVYSRVARTDIALENVDLVALLKGILEGYPQFQLPKAEITVSFPLPPVRGNVAALTQCLSNLVGNAVKFVPPGVVPHVKISAVTRDKRVRLSIQDNGIGIDPKMHGKIFAIFNRLSRDYEGTGIGLAVVRRAAERMGGAILVESELGKGTTFHLELNGASSE